MNTISLLQSQKITADEALADLQAIATDLEKQHHKAVITCADNSAIDAIESLQKQSSRNIIRATAAATDADRALVNAQNQLKAEARKAATEEFLQVDSNLRKVIADIDTAAAAYIAAVGQLGPANSQNTRNEALVRARALGARLAPDDLPKPTPDILNAHRAAVFSIEFLNSRALPRY